MIESGGKVTIRIYDNRIEGDLLLVGANSAESYSERAYWLEQLELLCSALSVDLLVVDNRSDACPVA